MDSRYTENNEVKSNLIKPHPLLHFFFFFFGLRGWRRKTIFRAELLRFSTGWYYAPCPSTLPWCEPFIFQFPGFLSFTPDRKESQNLSLCCFKKGFCRFKWNVQHHQVLNITCVIITCIIETGFKTRSEEADFISVTCKSTTSLDQSSMGEPVSYDFLLATLMWPWWLSSPRPRVMAR